MNLTQEQLREIFDYHDGQLTKPEAKLKEKNHHG
jgi:hypothetical protein